MKALHIMYVCGLCDTGGAAVAATRLHLQMLKDGIDSRVVCVWENLGAGKTCRCGADGIICLRTWWWWLGVRILHAVTRRWTHWLDLPGFDRVVRGFGPDEIHVHWIRRDTISWRQWRGMNERVNNEECIMENCGGRVPVVFVHLHDLWAMEQPQITAAHPTFVAYSDYVAHEVRRRGCKVERRDLILDPVFEDCRSGSLLRQDKDPKHLPLTRKAAASAPKVILFGCKDGRANPDKGFADLAAALALLPDELKVNVELRIFGEEPCGGAEAEKTAEVRTVLLGRIDEPERLKEEYEKAACFAFPSTSETMGMTKLEALACGCPVVAFDRTACAEGIEHLKTGYVAKDVGDFARGLEWFLGKA